MLSCKTQLTNSDVGGYQVAECLGNIELVDSKILDEGWYEIH